MSDENNANVGTVKANNHKDIGDCSRHFRHFRQENYGVGLKQENDMIENQTDLPNNGITSAPFSIAAK